MRILTIPFALACACGLAASEYRDNVGCGVGSMIFETSTMRDTIAGQVLAVTTNGTFCQTFFITTGTGNARKLDRFIDNRGLRDYTRENLDALARDMAAGKGEALVAFADLAGLKPEERTAFARRVQANFGKVFTSADVTSDQVLANLDKLAS